MERISWIVVKRTFSVPRLKRISLYWIQGIDLVNDNPENSLMREVDTIKSCQDKMRRTLEQVSIVLNRSNIIRKLMIIVFDSDWTWYIKYSIFLLGKPSTRIKSQCSPSTRAWSCQQRWRHWNWSYMPSGIVRAINLLSCLPNLCYVKITICAISINHILDEKYVSKYKHSWWDRQTGS